MSSMAGQVIKRAKYKASIKDPGAPGLVTFCYSFHVCYISSANALEAAKGSSATTIFSASSSAYEQFSTAELELRMKLMQVDGKLQKLHKQFVGSGVLTESEFWATRKMNKVTFNLTDEIKYQIFALKPAVHQAFINLVPSKIQEVDPTLDMEADRGDDYTHIPDHGIFRDGNKDITEQQNEQYRRSLSQDLNRQGAAVLQGRNLGRQTEGCHVTIYRQLEEIKEAVQSDFRHRVSLLVRPMHQV
ncbi:hypothetical protein ACLB2K_066256 [Fragaria x ananassa]